MTRRPRVPHTTWTAHLPPTALTVLLVSLDVAFHDQLRGIVVGLVAVPATSLARTGPQPCYTGVLALAAVLVSSVIDWHNRPLVLVATVANIALLTRIGHRMRRGTGASAPSPAKTTGAPSAQATAACATHPPRTHASRTFQLADVRMALRSLPQADRATMVADLSDVRETQYGTRALVADLMGKDDATRAAGEQLLHHWQVLAKSEQSLAEIARRLDTELAACTDRFAKALLLTLRDGRGELICCGHPLPLVLDDDGIRTMNVLSSLPPLGLFALLPHEPTVFTTSFSLSSAQRLLVHTDGIDRVLDEAGEAFPLRERVQALGECPPAALLDALAAELDEHAADGLGGLRDEALLLLLQGEKRAFRHVTTALRTAPAAT